MAPEIIAWLILAGVIIGLVVFNYFLVKYFEDRQEGEALPRWVAVFGLTLALLCVFIIPIDIYDVSSHSGKGDAIRIVYYILYSSVLAFAFGIIPFAYFYFEEDDEHATVKTRIWGGCKYTLFLIAIVLVLLLIGLIVFVADPSDDIPKDKTNAKAWANKIINNTNIAEASIAFAVASMTTLGYLIWITYAAYGLSAFPIGIIRGKKHIAEETSKVRQDLYSTKSKASEIKSKYQGTSKKMSRKEQEEIDLLARNERILEKHVQRLEGEQTWWRKLLGLFKPFFFLFGFVFAILSILIWVSILLTTIDRAAHTSLCGAKCGFILQNKSIFNPLDSLFTILSGYFPLDYVFIAVFIIYIYFAALSGIANIGVRFIWLHLYSLRKKATMPQGLLLTCIMLMLAVLALNMEVATIAPQYSRWGNQRYTVNGTTHDCSIDAPEGECEMTQIGQFISTISLKTSFFGVIFFVMSWLFLIAVPVGAIVAVFKKKASNIDVHSSDSDEDEF